MAILVAFMNQPGRTFCICALLIGVLPSSFAIAQQTDNIVTENGVRYRVTEQKIRRPISNTQWQEQQQTVYREKYDTNIQTTYRTVMVPVTEYRTETYLANRWNPFGTPYWATRQVPSIRWEARQQEIRTPVAQRSYVAEQQTVRVPVTNQQFVEDTITSKVAIGFDGNGTTAASANSAVANRPPEPRQLSPNSDPAPMRTSGRHF